jgi:hypothetical protein
MTKGETKRTQGESKYETRRNEQRKKPRRIETSCQKSPIAMTRLLPRSDSKSVVHDEYVIRRVCYASIHACALSQPLLVRLAKKHNHVADLLD